MEGMINIKDLFLNNIETIVGTTIGAILGGIITWFSNNKKIKKSIKVEIQLEVADKISKDIINILELINDSYDKVNALYIHSDSYYTDKKPREEKEYRLKLIQKSKNELEDSMAKLENEFEKHTTYLEINEIVIKQFYTYYRDVFDKFWYFFILIVDFDAMHSDKFYTKDSVQELKLDYERVTIATEQLLRSSVSFNDIILNEFYGKIFDTKKHVKIYEFHSGSLTPIEMIYQSDKFKDIYRKNKIKRKF